uniref:Sushi domain-containing protein n=1 Tax=Terrapene triunguis TaxID=2587831 RepID=A0A674JSF6_9SAUR
MLSRAGSRHQLSKHVLGAALPKGWHSGSLFFFFFFGCRELALSRGELPRWGAWGGTQEVTLGRAEEPLPRPPAHLRLLPRARRCSLTFSLPCLSLLLGTCDSPPRLSFAELPGAVNNSYPVGTKLKYSCRQGYMLGSGKSPFVTCLANSTWSVDPEFCVGECLCCFSISIDVQAILTQLGISLLLAYLLEGQPVLICRLAETENLPFPFVPMVTIPCRPPPDITHGSHTGQSEQQFLYGSAVTYKCDQGFSLIGEASIHCTTKDNVNGEWSGPAPECKGYQKWGKKQSGFVPDYSYGNTVIFECDSGYTLNGSSSVKCEANNSWVPSLPTCLHKYKQLLSVSLFFHRHNTYYTYNFPSRRNKRYFWCVGRTFGYLNLPDI